MDDVSREDALAATRALRERLSSLNARFSGAGAKGTAVTDLQRKVAVEVSPRHPASLSSGFNRTNSSVRRASMRFGDQEASNIFHPFSPPPVFHPFFFFFFFFFFFLLFRFQKIGPGSPRTPLVAIDGNAVTGGPSPRKPSPRHHHLQAGRQKRGRRVRSRGSFNTPLPSVAIKIFADPEGYGGAWCRRCVVVDALVDAMVGIPLACRSSHTRPLDFPQVSRHNSIGGIFGGPIAAAPR